MFTNAKKILITTESHEVFVIRSSSAERMVCPTCGDEMRPAPARCKSNERSTTTRSEYLMGDLPLIDEIKKEE